MPMSNWRFGAIPHDKGVLFQVWAPAQQALALALDGQPDRAMTRRDDGFFTIDVPTARAGQRYWFRVGEDLRPDPASRTFRSAAAKSLSVSPFMPADLDYAFAFTPPAGRLVAHMQTIRQGAVLFDATLSLERRPWTATEIRRALLRHPVMTASVVAGIHWQALKLWWRGVPLVPRLTPDGVGERAVFDVGTADQADTVMER